MTVENRELLGFLFDGKQKNELLDLAEKSLVIDAIGGSWTLGFFSKKGFSENHTYNPVNEKFVDKARFIKYGNKTFVNVLIWDIDEFDEIGYKPSLTQFHSYFENVTGFEPSWTVQTDKGYHVALVLKKGVFVRNKWGGETFAHKAVKRLKKEVTEILGADAAGSNRTVGIWRNPVTHKSVFSRKKYDLADLLDEFGIEIETPKPKTVQGTLNLGTTSSAADLKIKKSDGTISRFLDDGYVEGNRNNYIFAFGYKIKFENRAITDDALLSMMISENRKHGEGLTEKEVIAIHSSILKKAETMYVRSAPAKKVRGKLSNEMWARQIHGIQNRRSFAARWTAKEKSKRTVAAIVRAGLDLMEEGKAFDAKLISTLTNKCTKTIYRHSQNFNFRGLVFGAFISNLFADAQSCEQQKIDIRANVQKEMIEKFNLEIDWIFNDEMRRMGWGYAYEDDVGEVDPPNMYEMAAAIGF